MSGAQRPVQRPASRDDFEIAIVCALTLEADAVATLFDHDWDDGEDAESAPYDKASGDPNAYSAGRIGRHDVVVAHMPGMGKVHAAAVAANCRASWPNLKLALVVGICGAVPFPSGSNREIVLGDVVISSGVVQYDFGRRLPEQFIRKNTLPDSLGRPGMDIRALLAKLQGIRDRKKLCAKMAEHLKHLQEEPELRATYPGVEHDRLFDSGYRHVADGLTCDKAGCNGELVQRDRLVSQQGSLSPMVHFGLVASGDTVMKSGQERDRIAEEEGIVAFEMEGAGLWDVFPCLVIKGACDYADSHKTKAWQHYAAATAAACAKAFLEYWVPSSRAIAAARETRSTIIMPPEKPKTWSLIPYARNDSFIHRESIMKELLEQPQPLNSSAQSRTALFGLGGAGKTQIAIEYAYRAKEKDPDLSVFWVHASTAEQFRESYASLALTCAVAGHDDADTDTMKLVKDWMETENRPWLVIIDNADDAELFRSSPGSLGQYISECRHVSLFITTRNKQAGLALSKGKPLLQVGAMSDGESRELLRASLGTSSRNSDGDLSELSERLDRLPLALVQAASFMEAQSITVKAYLKLLKGSDRGFMRLLSEDFETVGRHSDTLRAVASTWVLSFEQIQKQDAVAAELLSLICFYDKHGISQDFLQAHLDHEAGQKAEDYDDDEEDSGFKLIMALGCLKAFSLISEAEDETLNVHRLVQLVTRKWLEDQGTKENYASQSMFALSDCFPEGGAYEDWEICSKYLPHAESVLRFKGTDSRDERLEKADLLYRKSRYLVQQGRWKEAERDLLKCLKIEKLELGDDHADTLAAMDNLALTYSRQGRWDEAEQLQVQALETRKSKLGTEHADTLTNMDSLASTYRNQDRLGEADELESEVVQARKALLGPDDPATLTSMNNLALTLRKQGQWQQAEKLAIEVVNSSQVRLGPDHPDTLTSMNNLAMTYWDQERYGEAEKLEAQVLEIRKTKLGEDHPDTLSSMNNLAWTWWLSGRKEDAVNLMRDCASRREKALGVAHPDAKASRECSEEWGREG